MTRHRRCGPIKSNKSTCKTPMATGSRSTTINFSGAARSGPNTLYLQSNEILQCYYQVPAPDCRCPGDPGRRDELFLGLLAGLSRIFHCVALTVRLFLLWSAAVDPGAYGIRQHGSGGEGP